MNEAYFLCRGGIVIKAERYGQNADTADLSRPFEVVGRLVEEKSLNGNFKFILRDENSFKPYESLSPEILAPVCIPISDDIGNHIKHKFRLVYSPFVDSANKTSSLINKYREPLRVYFHLDKNGMVYVASISERNFFDFSDPLTKLTEDDFEPIGNWEYGNQDENEGLRITYNDGINVSDQNGEGTSSGLSVSESEFSLKNGVTLSEPQVFFSDGENELFINSNNLKLSDKLDIESLNAEKNATEDKDEDEDEIPRYWLYHGGIVVEAPSSFLDDKQPYLGESDSPELKIVGTISVAPSEPDFESDETYGVYYSRIKNKNTEELVFSPDCPIDKQTFMALSKNFDKPIPVPTVFAKAIFEAESKSNVMKTYEVEHRRYGIFSEKKFVYGFEEIGQAMQTPVYAEEIKGRYKFDSSGMVYFARAGLEGSIQDPPASEYKPVGRWKYEVGNDNVKNISIEYSTINIDINAENISQELESVISRQNEKFPKDIIRTDIPEVIQAFDNLAAQKWRAENPTVSRYWISEGGFVISSNLQENDAPDYNNIQIVGRLKLSDNNANSLIFENMNNKDNEVAGTIENLIVKKAELFNPVLLPPVLEKKIEDSLSAQTSSEPAPWKFREDKEDNSGFFTKQIKVPLPGFEGFFAVMDNPNYNQPLSGYFRFYEGGKVGFAKTDSSIANPGAPKDDKDYINVGNWEYESNSQNNERSIKIIYKLNSEDESEDENDKRSDNFITTQSPLFLVEGEELKNTIDKALGEDLQVLAASLYRRAEPLKGYYRFDRDHVVLFAPKSGTSNKMPDSEAYKPVGVWHYDNKRGVLVVDYAKPISAANRAYKRTSEDALVTIQELADFPSFESRPLNEKTQSQVNWFLGISPYFVCRDGIVIKKTEAGRESPVAREEVAFEVVGRLAVYPQYPNFLKFKNIDDSEKQKYERLILPEEAFHRAFKPVPVPKILAEKIKRYEQKQQTSLLVCQFRTGGKKTVLQENIVVEDPRVLMPGFQKLGEAILTREYRDVGESVIKGYYYFYEDGDVGFAPVSNKTVLKLTLFEREKREKRFQEDDPVLVGSWEYDWKARGFIINYDVLLKDTKSFSEKAAIRMSKPQSFGKSTYMLQKEFAKTRSETMASHRDMRWLEVAPEQNFSSRVSSGDKYVNYLKQKRWGVVDTVIYQDNSQEAAVTLIEPYRRAPGGRGLYVYNPKTDTFSLPVYESNPSPEKLERFSRQIKYRFENAPVVIYAKNKAVGENLQKMYKKNNPGVKVTLVTDRKEFLRLTQPASENNNQPTLPQIPNA